MFTCVLGTVLRTSHVSSHSTLILTLGGTILFPFHRFFLKLSFKMINKEFVTNHMVDEFQSWDSNPGNLTVVA